MARASFAALKCQDVPAFVAAFHPGESDRFRKFARDEFADRKPDKEILQLRRLFTVESGVPLTLPANDPFTMVMGLNSLSQSVAFSANVAHRFWNELN